MHTWNRMKKESQAFFQAISQAGFFIESSPRSRTTAPSCTTSWAGPAWSRTLSRPSTTRRGRRSAGWLFRSRGTNRIESEPRHQSRGRVTLMMSRSPDYPSLNMLQATGCSRVCIQSVMTRMNDEKIMVPNPNQDLQWHSCRSIHKMLHKSE